MSDDRTGLADELCTLVDRRLVDPLEILLDSPELLTLLREHVAAQVGEWAHDLLGHDPAAAMSTASRLLAALFDGDDFSPPTAWWQSAFGQIVARRIGYPGRSALSGVQAAAMLGISRQGVHDLVRRGKLGTDEDGRILTASVQERLAPSGHEVAG
ncbi:helix-turn-helix domain-containing protein [Ruania albidiflava]|uniref:helix-turn-helix domain-containing protein n=1 Tax=Ruania albidiflava TaxID=366586 RepID=UPI0003B436B4|nr:helix-turn-helix domain-containing protein [Ruania albidiflava]